MNQNSKKDEARGKIVLIVVIIIFTLFALFSCAEGGSSSSSYDLYNKDGSINWQYYNDMQNYFEKHPEKRP